LSRVILRICPFVSISLAHIDTEHQSSPRSYSSPFPSDIEHIQRPLPLIPTTSPFNSILKPQKFQILHCRMLNEQLRFGKFEMLLCSSTVLYQMLKNNEKWRSTTPPNRRRDWLSEDFRNSQNAQILALLSQLPKTKSNKMCLPRFLAPMRDMMNHQVDGHLSCSPDPTSPDPNKNPPQPTDRPCSVH